MKSTAKYRDAPKVSKELPSLQGQAELDYPARDPKLWGLHSSQVAEEHQFVTEVSVAGRPSNLVFRATNRAPYWTFYSVMDYYREEVSILDTIISRSVTEIFRYGIDFEPAFVKKCTNCGHEYQNNVSVCPYCNSRALIRPDESQKDYFVRPDGTSFIDEVNENGQSLKDLCRSYADAQYQNNQAYLLVITGDVIDSETKHLEHSYPLEFISVDPKYVRFLYDETAEPGNLFGFTMDDRHMLIPLSKDPKALNAYTPDGKTLYPAFWQVGSAPGASGELWAYTKDEIYTNHWFKQTLIYGVPQWYSIEDDLLAYHYIEKHNLQRYKYGYVRKILVFPGFSDEVMRNVAKGVQEVLAKSDLSIPIVGLPPQPAGTGELRAQTLDLGTENISELMQVKNDIRDRLCAHIGVPNLFVGDVSASGGMNNESQQITTFDRYLMDKYDYCDDMLDWILSWFPKITDWKLRVVRPSKGDQENKRLLEQIQVAQGFKNLGFGITYSNGEFTYTEKPVDGNGANVNMAVQDPNAPVGSGYMGNGMGQDSEQMATQDEVGDSLDELDDQITASHDAMTARRIREIIKADRRSRDSSFRIQGRPVHPDGIPQRHRRGAVRTLHPRNDQGHLRIPPQQQGTHRRRADGGVRCQGRVRHMHSRPGARHLHQHHPGPPTSHLDAQGRDGCRQTGESRLLQRTQHGHGRALQGGAHSTHGTQPHPVLREGAVSDAGWGPGPALRMERTPRFTHHADVPFPPDGGTHGDDGRCGKQGEIV